MWVPERSMRVSWIGVAGRVERSAIQARELSSETAPPWRRTQTAASWEDCAEAVRAARSRRNRTTTVIISRGGGMSVKSNKDLAGLKAIGRIVGMVLREMA